MGARSTGSHPTTTKADGHLLEYYRQTFSGGGGGTNYVPPPPEGLTASGGIISDYTEPGPGSVYRAHVFTSSGTFNVTAIGDYGSTVDYLVVGGGGAGGNAHGSNATGGGGAGGLRTNMPACPYAQAAYPISTTNPYTVVVGGGGATYVEPNYSRRGSDSEIYPTPGGSGSGIFATGGGAGSSSTFTPDPEASGGSGGGEDTYDSGNLIGSTVASPDGRSPTTQGFAGGSATPSPAIGGGGGGAGEAGNTDGQGYGGDGLQILIAEPPATPAPTRTVGADGGYFAGGGGGNHGPQPQASKPGGLGGGGGNTTPGGGRGTYATGGGGGGAFSATPGPALGHGGSGIVVIRYQINSISSVRATGGVVSYYGGKTIHTFTSSGTFITESNWSATDVEYVVIAGGGGGGVGGNAEGGGGGGAGGYRTGTTPIGAHPVSTTIQVGAGGLGGIAPGPTNTNSKSTQGTPSYFGSPITSTGGGAGTQGASAHPSAATKDGGSGGGGGYTGPYGAGNTPPVSPEQGTRGGSYSAYGGGGGGGAGGIGQDGTGDTSAPFGGSGGKGRQIPGTFRSPESRIGAPGPTGPVPANNPGGDTSGNFWFAGGGGGGTYDPSPQTSKGGRGGAGSLGPTEGPYAGGGNGGVATTAGEQTHPGNDGSAGHTNTGGGGGSHGNQNHGFHGGSGVVLIAYPT